jgi:cell division protein FtsL
MDRINQTNTMNNEFESTYTLIVRSEDVSRSRLETLLYVVLILTAVLSIWQFANQTMTLSTEAIVHKYSAAMSSQRS